MNEPNKKLSAEELFNLLENENEWEDVGIEILPNGELRRKGSTNLNDIKPKKPITMREDLGGEYGRGIYETSLCSLRSCD